MDWAPFVGIVVAGIAGSTGVAIAVIKTASKTNDQIVQLKLDITEGLAILKTELTALRVGSVAEHECRGRHETANATLYDLRHRLGEMERKLMQTPLPKNEHFEE